MTTASNSESTRPLRRQKPPPVPKSRRTPAAEPPPPSASCTMPIQPEDIIGELDR